MLINQKIIAMKTFYSCIICIICIVCIDSISCTAQVKDDFSDGDFTNNPEWTGNTEQFGINSSAQLHLQSSGSDTSVLATRSVRGKNTEWSFWMKLSFNTSSNNYARVYLSADTSWLSLPLNGYFLQAGGGDDSISIVKQTGTALFTLFRFKSYRTFHSTNTLRFKITCDSSGLWEAKIDTTGGNNYISDGSFFGGSFQSSKWVGVFCRYTSSNATKFYFDDFYAGPIILDTVPARVISVEATEPGILQVGFSEPVEKQSAENPENYRLLLQGVRPDSVIQDMHQPGVVSIVLHTPLPDGTIDSLQIKNIPDLTGNRLLDTVVKVCYYQPKASDVLIHEIMADPDPPVELPNGEFVELYNRSAFPVNLRDWSFQYGSYSKVFTSVIVPSHGYLLIVKDSAFLNFAPCAVLFSSSSSLSNEGTTLTLKDNRNHVVHSVSYSPDWYRGSFKEEGGWSLEMIDSSNPCGCKENWGPCGDASGGTPGRGNSTGKPNPDNKSPVAERAVISDSTVLEVTFSEAMDSISLLSLAGWAVSYPDGVRHPVGVNPVSPGFNMTNLLLDKPFQKGITYTLKISGALKDCAGNDCDTTRSIRFAIPDSVTGHDVVVNEILSNPATGGSRFVELYNRSEKIIDLQSLAISNRDTSSGFLANAVPLFERGYLLFPGGCVAITPVPEDICNRYRPLFPENIIGLSGFPVFGDDTGTVIIARKDNMLIIDRMQYNPDMHYPLLATTEGVSLERTNPGMPSDDESNWHSAAETAGFATPGYRNSHWIIPEGATGEIIIQPAIFSPDNDGRDDLLTITLRENDPGYAVNIVVYDARGRLVSQIANNVLFGSEGVFIWDGMTVAQRKATMGFYVLLVELTRPDGTVRKIKKTVVLGGKL
jgi:hypothetical protein